MVKILFCDIDETLTESITGHVFKQHPLDIKLMRGVAEAITHFSKQYKIVGISNQGGCSAINRNTGKPHKTIENAVAEMQYTLQLLPQLDSIYFCPDFHGNLIYRVFPQDYIASERHLYLDPFYQSFRKPGAGMLQKAAHDLGLTLKDACMVGDRLEDEQAAANAGINFCPADIWRDRFKPGLITHEVTREQLRFPEGIN